MASAESAMGYPQSGLDLDNMTLPKLILSVARSMIKVLLRKIPLTIVLLVLSTLLHTYLLAGPNDGYGRELTLLSDILATDGRYGMTGTGSNALGATLIWAVLSALATYTFYRIRAVGLSEYLGGYRRGLTWVRDSFTASGQMAVPALLVGAAIALAIVGLFRNNGLAMVLCMPLIAVLGEQLESLWFLFLQVGWRDIQKAAAKIGRRLNPFNPAGACVGTIGAAAGFLVGYVLPGVRLSRTPAFAGAFLLIVVAAVIAFLRRGGRRPTMAIFLLAFTILLIATPVYAHDKGVKEEGGWRNWLTQPGVLDAIARGLPPAVAVSLGLPIGVSLTQLQDSLRKLTPDQRQRVYDEVTRRRPELLYPESLKVPHDHTPPDQDDQGQSVSFDDIFGERTGKGLPSGQKPVDYVGGAPPPKPPTIGPIHTTDRVYSGGKALEILQGLGILKNVKLIRDANDNVIRVEPPKVSLPGDNLDSLLGNNRSGGTPYDHVLEKYKDNQGNVAGQDVRQIVQVKGVAFDQTDDGKIDLRDISKISIVAEQGEDVVSQSVAPGPSAGGGGTSGGSGQAGGSAGGTGGQPGGSGTTGGTGSQPGGSGTSGGTGGQPGSAPVKQEGGAKGASTSAPTDQGGTQKTGQQPNPTDASGQAPAQGGKAQDTTSKADAKAQAAQKALDQKKGGGAGPQQPKVTETLRNRIRDAVKSPDTSGVSHLTLRMQDFSGMIPPEVKLPAGMGWVKGVRISFNPEEGTVRIQADDCNVLKLKGAPDVVIRPSVENGKLSMPVEYASVMDPNADKLSFAAGLIADGTVTKPAAETVVTHGLQGVNNMISQEGVVVQGVTVRSDGVHLVLGRSQPNQ